MTRSLRSFFKHAVAVVLLVCAVIFIEAGFRQDIRNLESDGVSIVCFGDSITYGYGAERGEDYPSALTKYIGGPVINAGADGDTSAQGLARLQQDVLAKQPFLVIVEFGANDFLDQVPLEQTRVHMQEVIRLIHEHGAMAAVVDISAGLLFGEYRDIAQSIARENGCIFIPNVLRGIITNPSLKSDFVHPNAKGYSLIAQRVFLSIRPYLLHRHFSRGTTINR